MKKELTTFELLPEELLLLITFYSGNPNLLLTSKYLHSALHNVYASELKKLYHPANNFYRQLSEVFYSSGKKAFIKEYGKEWLPASSVGASYKNDIIKDYYSLQEALTLYQQDVTLLFSDKIRKSMLPKLTLLKEKSPAIQFKDTDESVPLKNVAEFREIIITQWLKTFEPITLPKVECQLQNKDLADLMLEKIAELTSRSDSQFRNTKSAIQHFNSLLLLMQFFNQARQQELTLRMVFNDYWAAGKSHLLDLETTSAKSIIKLCDMYTHKNQPLIFRNALHAIMIQGLEAKKELGLLQSVLNAYLKSDSDKRDWLPVFMRYAVEYGHVEAAKLFVALGQKDMNIYSSIQRGAQELRLTLLELALEKNNVEMLNLLLTHKADPRLVFEFDIESKTVVSRQSDDALIYASSHASVEVNEILLRAWKKMPDEKVLNECMDRAFINYYRKPPTPYLEVAALYLALLPNLSHSTAKQLFASFNRKKDFSNAPPGASLPDDKGFYPAKSREFLALYLRYSKYMNLYVESEYRLLKANEIARPIRLFGIFKAYEVIEGAEKAASFKQRVLNLAKDINQNSLATDVASLDFYFGQEKLTKLH